MANTTKVTKKDMFNEVITIAEGLGRQDIVDFANHEIELLEKKASKSRQTKTQKENEALMDTIGVMGFKNQIREQLGTHLL